jgi:hypothetical protein
MGNGYIHFVLAIEVYFLNLLLTVTTSLDNSRTPCFCLIRGFRVPEKNILKMHFINGKNSQNGHFCVFCPAERQGMVS